MTPAQVRTALDEGVIPLDLRTPRPFAAGHLSGAVNLMFNRADLAERAELLLHMDQAYLVHAEPEAVARMAVKLLQDAGFTVRGHLEGGLKAWQEAGFTTERLEVLSVDELHGQLADVQVLDVREGFEFRHAHIPDAWCVPWTDTWEQAAALHSPRPLAVVCGDEVRSAAAASILQRYGHHPFLVLGGMVDWQERQYPTEKTVRA